MNYIQKLVEELEFECKLDSSNPEDKNLLRLYALLVLVKGSRTTVTDVHNAWAVWKDAADPSHHSLAPFDLLSPAVQGLDLPYTEAIKKLAVKQERDAGEMKVYSLLIHRTSNHTTLYGVYSTMAGAEAALLQLYIDRGEEQLYNLKEVAIGNWESIDSHGNNYVVAIQSLED